MGKSLDNIWSCQMHEVYMHQLYIPQGCQGMSEVNKMCFHWTLQVQLSLKVYFAVIWKNYFNATYTFWLVLLFSKIFALWISS